VSLQEYADIFSSDTRPTDAKKTRKNKLIFIHDALSEPTHGGQLNEMTAMSLLP
jgi:hypothetical protein